MSKKENPQASWPEIINAITTPLKMAALLALITNGIILSIVPNAQGSNQQILGWGAIACLLILVGTICYMLLFPSSEGIGTDVERMKLTPNDLRLLFCLGDRSGATKTNLETVLANSSSTLDERLARLHKLGLVDALPNQEVDSTPKGRQLVALMKRLSDPIYLSPH